MPRECLTTGSVFGFYRVRFHFRTRDAIYFPPGKSGNIIRGAFGTILRRIACAPDCPGARDCPREGNCPYVRIFEPKDRGTGPSGLVDWPRPFVFRASHLSGQTVPAGTTFHFDVHLFDLAEPAIPYFVLTFAELARSGLGPGRGRAELIAADQLDCNGQLAARIYDGIAMNGGVELIPSAIPLVPGNRAIHGLQIGFVTPTELKHDQKLAVRPDFAILFARVRDRIATLNALYGSGTLNIDFKAMADRAAAVRMTACKVTHLDVERQSSRTGQRHPISGFIGTAEYVGGLTEFEPFLQAATYAGVGRQTTFGNGEVRIIKATHELE